MQFQKNPQKIAEMLEEFKKNGFDRIHIPGGTSLSADHYSGTFVYHYDPQTAQIFLLGVPYNSSFHKGEENGSHNKKDGLPVETANRELFEETGIQAELADFVEVFSYQKNLTHKKYFYVLDYAKAKGNLFDFGFKPNPIDQETSTPILIPARMFKEIGGGPKCALDEIITHLKGLSTEFAWALMNL